MKILTHTEQLHTQGRNDCVDLTETVQAAVSRAKLRNGQATVFVTPPPVSGPPSADP